MKNGVRHQQKITSVVPHCLNLLEPILQFLYSIPILCCNGEYDLSFQW